MPTTGPGDTRLDVAGAPFGARQPVQWDDFAVDALRFLGGDLEGEDRAVDFGARGADRLARFEGNGAREFFAAGGDAGADLFQDFGPLPRRQLARRLERRRRRRNGRLDLSGAGAMDHRHQQVVIRAADVDGIARFGPLAVDQDAILAQLPCIGRIRG